ncbi:hypothetical protein JA1_003745 [Spathaspora sp. JA1]|nr:hypothetical protein JA1_003745 [Spathaspora sp. JA1]
MSDHDAEYEDVEDVEEPKVLTMDELQRKNKALVAIEDFLQSENSQLKKSLEDIQKENEELKNLLRNNFKVDYKSDLQYKE